MINKTSLVLAAAIAVASSAVARADAMFHDSNTGLPTTIYNQPLYQLQQEGLPLSPAAQAYLKQHPQNVAARSHRGTVSVRSSAQALGVYQTNQPTFFDADNKQSGHY